MNNTADSLETLRCQAEELEPKLEQFEDALFEIDHLSHGPRFLREQLTDAAKFRGAGDTRREQICYLKASLAFELLEAQVLTHK